MGSPCWPARYSWRLHVPGKKPEDFPSIQLDQRTKGESDIAVAAASILARERFVEWMDKTSAAGGVTLPLGASAAVIEAAKQVVAKHGTAALGKVAKLHFKTTAAVTGGAGTDPA